MTSFRAIRGELLRSTFSYDLNFTVVDGLLSWNTQRFGEVVGERFRREIRHLQFGKLPTDVSVDSFQQMSLARSGLTVQKQRIEMFAGRTTDLASGHERQFVARSVNEFGKIRKATARSFASDLVCNVGNSFNNGLRIVGCRNSFPFRVVLSVRCRFGRSQ